jgi:hypothetical protein
MILICRAMDVAATHTQLHRFKERRHPASRLDLISTRLASYFTNWNMN